MDTETKISFTITQKMKYFSVELTKLVQHLHTEEYTILMKEIKEEPHK